MVKPSAAFGPRFKLVFWIVSSVFPLSSGRGSGAKRTLFFRIDFGAPLGESVVVKLPPAVDAEAAGEAMESGALPVPRGTANADVYEDPLGSDINVEGASDELIIAEFSPNPLVLPISD